MDYKENVIEWVTGSDTITLTLTQKRFINKVKSLKKRYPNEVDFIENQDGSILAHLPLKSLKLSIITSSLSDEQKKANAERLRGAKGTND